MTPSLECLLGAECPALAHGLRPRTPGSCPARWRARGGARRHPRRPWSRDRRRAPRRGPPDGLLRDSSPGAIAATWDAYTRKTPAEAALAPWRPDPYDHRHRRAAGSAGPCPASRRPDRRGCRAGSTIVPDTVVDGGYRSSTRGTPAVVGSITPSSSTTSTIVALLEQEARQSASPKRSAAPTEEGEREVFHFGRILATVAKLSLLRWRATPDQARSSGASRRFPSRRCDWPCSCSSSLWPL